MLRLVVFVVPANVLWALLPLVAQRRLGTGSAGYGLLLTAAGVGAVAGALLMPRLARALSATGRLAWSGAVFGVGMVVLGTGRSVPVAVVTLLPVGVARIVVIAGLNSAVQSSLPAWVRARALSIYQVVLFTATAAGAALWGLLAQRFGVPQAFCAAGVLLFAGALSVRRWRLPEHSPGAREVVDYWPSLEVVAPAPAADPAADPADDRAGRARRATSAGPVVVQIRYVVPTAHLPEFLAACGPVEHSRRRTGAVSWGLYRDLDEPGVVVEQFGVADLDDHLAQHRERLTRTDEEDQEHLRALASHVDGARHLVHVPLR